MQVPLIMHSIIHSKNNYLYDKFFWHESLYIFIPAKIWNIYLESTRETLVFDILISWKWLGTKHTPQVLWLKCNSRVLCYGRKMQLAISVLKLSYHNMLEAGWNWIRWSQRIGVCAIAGIDVTLINLLLESMSHLIHFQQLLRFWCSLDGSTKTGGSLKWLTFPRALWSCYTTKHQRMAQVENW